MKVDRFAADNMTYAVLGDQLKYWQLFAAQMVLATKLAPWLTAVEETLAGRIPPNQGHMLSLLG